MKIINKQIIINKIIKNLKELKKRFLIMNLFEEIEYINDDIKSLKNKSIEELIEKYKMYL